MKKPAYALATILVLLGVAMFGAAALVTISVLDSRISRSQEEGTSAYYVTEAGAQDAMWRIANTPAYSNALQAGTLNTSYSVSNKPAAGQGYSVTMQTGALNPGYATITVVGTSNNGSFTAQRKIVTTVFQSPPTPPTGSNAMMAGGTLTITNATTNMSVSNGDFYSSGAMTFNQATLNMNSGSLYSPSTYSAVNATVNGLGSVHASSCSPTPAGGCLPAAAIQTIPTFNFAYYAANNNKSYTAASFQTFVSGKSSPVSIPGPVTYINGNLTMNAWMKNVTLNVTGMLVINGSLTANATGMKINIIDPGNGKSGIFVNGGVNNSSGIWTINGLFYSSGAITFTNSQTMTITGAFLTPGAIQLNTGTGMTLNYDGSAATAVFGASGPAGPVTTQYWEEQY